MQSNWQQLLPLQSPSSLWSTLLESATIAGCSVGLAVRWAVWFLFGLLLPLLLLIFAFDILAVSASDEKPLSSRNRVFFQVYGFALFALLSTSLFRVLVRNSQNRAVFAVCGIVLAYGSMMATVYQRMPDPPVAPVPPFVMPNLATCMFHSQVTMLLMSGSHLLFAPRRSPPARIWVRLLVRLQQHTVVVTVRTLPCTIAQSHT